MTPAQYQDLVVQFVADLLHASIDAPTAAAQAHALSAYLETLRPWLDLADVPLPPRPGCPLFTSVAFAPAGPDDELIQVTLSPEGEAFFQAWLAGRRSRRRPARSTEGGSHRQATTAGFVRSRDKWNFLYKIL